MPVYHGVLNDPTLESCLVLKHPQRTTVHESLVLLQARVLLLHIVRSLLLLPFCASHFHSLAISTAPPSPVAQRPYRIVPCKTRAVPVRRKLPRSLVNAYPISNFELPYTHAHRSPAKLDSTGPGRRDPHRGTFLPSWLNHRPSLHVYSLQPSLARVQCGSLRSDLLPIADLRSRELRRSPGPCSISVHR